ncbi:MAG: hypothetical protein GXO08_01650 [Aquificae bacterium]|nr:hypothetical protein [Aquificota bacterium]
MFFKRRFSLEGGLFLFLVGGAFFVILYSPTLIEVFPLFKVRHLEVKVSDPSVEEAVRRALAEFKNNWLLLRLNFERFENRVREETDFYAERVFLKRFDPFGGRLEVEVSLNRPAFLLNDRWLVAESGRVFRAPLSGELPRIYDPTGEWRPGDLYGGERLKLFSYWRERFGVKTVEVGEGFVRAEGEKLSFKLPSAERFPAETVKQIETIFPERRVSLNLYGSKSAAVKIYKE